MGRARYEEGRWRHSDHDALVERLVGRHAEASTQLDLADQEEAETILSIHLVIREQAQILEDLRAEVVGFVDDQYRSAAGFKAKTGNLILDLAIEGSAVTLGRKAHLPGDGLVEVHHIAGGQGDVDDAIQAGVEASDDLAAGAGFAATALAGDESDAPELYEVSEAGLNSPCTPGRHRTIPPGSQKLPASAGR